MDNWFTKKWEMREKKVNEKYSMLLFDMRCIGLLLASFWCQMR